jgi:hypothetical protein
MFSGVLKAFKEFFSKDRIFILIMAIILLWTLTNYSCSKSQIMDGLEDGTDKTVNNIAPSVQAANSLDNETKSVVPNVANPMDLLPADANTALSSLNPTSMNGEMPDLLSAGHHIGLDTIGQTLKNANLQLRSDPIITKAETGPWNQSTIETNYGGSNLEIGI